MGKNYASLFFVALTLSALPLACGDDEEGDGGGKGGGSTGGSKATGGASGTGTGGKATGGTGTGGKATGGTGTGGKATGGTGTGGTTSTGGTTPGGAGGEGGAMGGEGGGGSEATLCERFCETADANSNCTNQGANCVTRCEEDIALGIQYGYMECEDLLPAYYECQIAGPPGDWACFGTQPALGGTTCSAEAAAVNASYCYPP